jgi:hypothetical protein
MGGLDKYAATNHCIYRETPLLLTTEKISLICVVIFYVISGKSSAKTLLSNSQSENPNKDNNVDM